MNPHINSLNLICYADGVRDTVKTYSGAEICVWEAAQILHMSTGSIRRMIDQGLLIAWRPNPRGRKLMLWEQQVRELKSTQQAEAAETSRLLQLEFEF